MTTYLRANRRFNTVVAISMVVFLAACLGLAWADTFPPIPKWVLWLACVVAVIALLVPIWAQWRFINEIDEYLRSIQLRAIFLGLAVVLVLASAWGFVELYIDSPPVSMFWLNPLYWVAYSLSSTVLTHREGTQM